MKRLQTMLAAVVVAAALAACGGGGGGGGGDDDDDDNALDEVPASASASAKGLVTYLGKLVDALMAGETSEPVAIEKFDPVQPDDTEPEPLT